MSKAPKSTKLSLDPLISGDRPDPQSKLTFGIELEFILVTADIRPDELELQVPAGFWPIRILERALSEDLEATCRECHEVVKFSLNLNTSMGYEGFDAWKVKFELVGPSAEELSYLQRGYQDPEDAARTGKYVATGIELVSRVLSTGEYLMIPVDDYSHIHQISAEEEISAVLQKLRSKFQSFEKNDAQLEYLYANKNCGFHVHVGQKDAGFDIETVRKVLCANVVNERLFDQLHAVTRINGTDRNIRPLQRQTPNAAILTTNRSMDPEVDNDPPSVPLSDRSARYDALDKAFANPRARETENDFPFSLFRAKPELENICRARNVDAWRTLIEHAPQWHDLVDLFWPRPRSQTINLKDLVEVGGKTNTLEFRQHCGTLQTKPVLAWIDIVLRLVSACKALDWHSLSPLLDANGPMRLPHADVLQLSQLLGCKIDTQKYVRAMLVDSYAKGLRHTERKEAIEIRPPGPLSSLALHNINNARVEISADNIRSRIRKKFLAGSYGQYPRQFVDEFFNGYAARPGETIPENDKDRITSGYDPTLDAVPGAFVPARFARPESRQGSSGSERSSQSGYSGRYDEHSRRSQGVRAESSAGSSQSSSRPASSRCGR